MIALVFAVSGVVLAYAAGKNGLPLWTVLVAGMLAGISTWRMWR